MDKFFVNNYLKSRFKALVRLTIMQILPNSFNSAFARLGFTGIVKRNIKIKYIGNIFLTKYRIYANTGYAIERYATASTIPSHEPINGIIALGMKDFNMLDIGANVGTYSISAIAYGASKVYSIEPGPLFSKLLLNIELNKLKDNILPYKIGFASFKGVMRWFEDANNIGNAHLLGDDEILNVSKVNTKLTKNYVEVPVTTLDSFMDEQKISNIDLIKIDVEGMEWEVLRSGAEMISSFLPIIVVETHRNICDMKGVDCITPLFDFFYNKGYTSFSYIDGEFIKFIYPNFNVDTFFIHQSKADQISNNIIW